MRVDRSKILRLMCYMYILRNNVYYIYTGAIHAVMLRTYSHRLEHLVAH